jgi:hypothetical protein
MMTGLHGDRIDGRIANVASNALETYHWRPFPRMPAPNLIRTGISNYGRALGWRPDRSGDRTLQGGSMTNKKQTRGLAKVLTDRLNAYDLEGPKLGQPPTAKRVEFDRILP